MESGKNQFVESTHRLAMPALTVAFALLLTGCAANPNPPVQTNVAAFGGNVNLIYVPGIGGYGRDDRAWVNGLHTGGYEGKTEVWDWTGNMRPLSALWAHARHRAQSRRIAERIHELRSESPDRPIVLVGHSAGAGVAVGALEDLPADVRVDELVLLAPAVSRTYDLSGALRHVRRRAHVFYSERDTLVLEIGTSLFGTVDGVHGESAGHGGFVRPPRASREAYARLVVHPYSDERRLAGDDGGHEGVLTPGIAESVIDPLLPGYRSADTPIGQASAHELP